MSLLGVRSDKMSKQPAQRLDNNLDVPTGNVRRPLSNLETFPRWLLVFFTAWTLISLLAWFVLERYHGRSFMPSEMSLPQMFIVYGAASAGANGSWKLVRQWRGYY
ncbi:uncharacterized protein RHO25_003169 [Cercospora beticola]|uniref:Uncharacterized protein n=1 Tax=Cercospora beticola TaxID=122368 RepID=A0ABZ0NGA0_CERBT|nr:hypothetical protein RHO25_003169 [Cercospora beticola]CAK1359819.1 unnamed protein product [Cercospora beticola]